MGIPDIRNISYPSELFGPDFVGTDVDFDISYQSINTDYVRLYNGTNFTQISSSKIPVETLKNVKSFKIFHKLKSSQNNKNFP